MRETPLARGSLEKVLLTGVAANLWLLFAYIGWSLERRREVSISAVIGVVAGGLMVLAIYVRIQKLAARAAFTEVAGGHGESSGKAPIGNDSKGRQ